MNKPISEKICEFRKARSLTQEKLGEQLNISSQAVSKWEKGDSMPDIMILPKLCEILGITVDALLEVPTSVKKESCMNNLSEYAKEIGGIKASFEAIKACSNAVDNQMNRGSALQAYDGIRICTSGGIGFVVNGENQMNTILNTDIEHVKKICGLLSDENVLKIMRSLDFSRGVSEIELMEKSCLSMEEVDNVLFKLMKQNYCECTADGFYIFGGFSYTLIVILCGIFLSSTDGHKQINCLSRNYPPRDNEN